MTELAIPPLEDPGYEPVHRPENGKPPAIVAKWGAASQVRWFRRFWASKELALLTEQELAPFHCHSTEHKGACCLSCEYDAYDGYSGSNAGCCCRSPKKWADDTV